MANTAGVVNMKQAIRDDEDIAPSLWNRWHLLYRHVRMFVYDGRNKILHSNPKVTLLRKRYVDLLSFELNRSEYIFKGKRLHWLPVSNPWYQQAVENLLVSKK
ncbi:hypothetical protein T4E_6673 [Trichinella pseudospiralis]|uniref:Uncharacterized protein n=1 Tax=Trichinella pseudospiralis TaxID=6337 RepID=A0A0V0XGK0_TRIPS|nr:hypothetical protein T4E_6673 [Trichinella pseudospiralis]